MRPKGTAAELEQRRVDAVRQLRSGERVVAVARSLGVSTTAVQNWKRVVKNDGGLRALRAKPQHVPLCRLTAQQKRRLRTVLLRGAAAAGLADATESKTSVLTAMRDFELQDEFSELVARRVVALTTCGGKSRKRNLLWLGLTAPF